MFSKSKIIVLGAIFLALGSCDSGSTSTSDSSTVEQTPDSSTIEQYSDSSTLGDTAETPTESFLLTLEFTGPSVSPSTVYAAWLEDAQGNNIQNIYICNRVVGSSGGLLGDALPQWLTLKYPQNDDIDGVTGASIQEQNTITRDISSIPRAPFRVVFEIDRSKNNNEYFGDRPAFVYRTELIDTNQLQNEYALTLYSWMSNGTDTGTYSQAPSKSIGGYAPYKIMTELSYVQPHNDMVISLKATISKN